MESSEEAPCDGPLDLNNSSSGSKRIVCSNYDDYIRKIFLLNQNDQADESVVGFLDKDSATLVLDSIEIDGNQLILPDGFENELFFYVDPEERPSVEHTLSQPTSENSDNIQTEVQHGLNNLGAVNNEGIQIIERNDLLQNRIKNGTLHIEQAHVDSHNNQYSSEALDYRVQEEEDTTEMVFIPTTSRVISLNNNTGFIHFSGIVQPTAALKLHGKEEIECARKVSEESVIVSQEPHTDSFSNIVDDVRVCAVNKENNNNSLHDKHMASEIEASSIIAEDSSSMLSMSPREIKHAVCDPQTTALSLVCDQNWRTKNIQEDKSETEDVDQLDLALSAVSNNVNYVEYSNLKESLNSEFFSESPLMRELSNHSDLKSCTNSSNKYDNANSETSVTVEETTDEDTSESIHFPSQFSSSENINDDPKWKDPINCSNNDSYILEDCDQNLDNKMCYASSKNYENGMDFINSEEVCSENQTCIAKASLSVRDDSESKNSFFSGNAQLEDHDLQVLTKIKSLSPNEVKVIDEYDFENSSGNPVQELIHNSSLDRQSSDDISTEIDATELSQSVNSDLEVVTGNLTFQGILTPVTDSTKINETLDDIQNSKTCYDNSQYSFDQVLQHKEDNKSSKIFKSTNGKFSEHKQNLVFNEDRKTDENILALKNVVNIDNKSKENENMLLNIAASDKTTIKPPEKTNVRKKRNSDSVKNIELFFDDFSDSEPHSSAKIFCIDNQQDQSMIYEYHSADEDEYVDSISSNLKNRIKEQSTHVDEKTISLKSESSDHLQKIPDPVTDAKGSLSTGSVNIHNKSDENVAVYDETTIKLPQKTYVRKKRTSDFIRNIKLFSDDEQYSTSETFCIDNKQEQIMIDEFSSPDEDGYVNLMPSCVKSRVKARSIPVEERSISLRPESSDHRVKIVDAEDSVSTCGISIDNNSEENNGLFLNLATSNECTVTVKPHDFSDSEPHSSPMIFCIDNEQEQSMIDECHSTDEDEYVNSMSSNLKNRTEEKGTRVDEKTISLKSESSDLLQKIPDPVTDAKGSLSTCSVSIHNKSDENVAVSGETTIKLPQKTYVRKKRTSDSIRNIKLFSDDEQYSTSKTFCIDNKQEQIMIDEFSSPDEDGYVNLMPSCVKSRVKARSIPVEERSISLRPESSDHLVKIVDPVMDAEDSVSTCGISIDNNSKENNSLFLNLATSNECTVTVKPPLRTYVRKKRTSDSFRNIELFSDDEQYSTPKTFYIDNKQEQIMIDEFSSPDEDGYVNLMPCVKSRVKARSIPVEERSISLRPESSDHLLKIVDLVMDAEDSVSTSGVSIDNNSKENDSILLNLTASNESTVKPPQRTYIRKKRTSDSFKKVELLSDYFSDTEPYTLKNLCIDNEQEQISIDDYNLTDEDGCVNLMPSYVKNRFKAQSTAVEEKSISLRPESSIYLEKNTDLLDAEDSENICCGTFFTETSLQNTEQNHYKILNKNTEKPVRKAPKSFSCDVAKVESARSFLKKRMQTPSHKKICKKISGYKSCQVWHKSIKGLPINMKNTSSGKRKVSLNVKKTLKNSENCNHSLVSMVHHKIGQPTKDKSESILYSFSSLPERLKTCDIRFLNDNSTEKNDCEIDELSTPKSAQELKNFQYICSNCHFVSNKVNNLIIHMKYCEFKSSADMIDYEIHDMGGEQMHGEFLSLSPLPLYESLLTEVETSSSQNSSNDSFTLNKLSSSHSTTSEPLYMTCDTPTVCVYQAIVPSVTEPHFKIP